MLYIADTIRQVHPRRPLYYRPRSGLYREGLLHIPKLVHQVVGESGTGVVILSLWQIIYAHAVSVNFVAIWTHIMERWLRHPNLGQEASTARMYDKVGNLRVVALRLKDGVYPV